MKLNLIGDAALGVGHGTISINGAVPSALSAIAGGEPRWLSNTLIVFQDDTSNGAADVLKTYNTSSHAVTTVSSPGENRLAAGAGVWCASLNPAVRSSLAGFGPFPSSGLGDLSREGQIGLIVNWASGSGVAVYDAAGAGLWQLADVLTGGTNLALRSNLTAYSNSAGWHIWQNSPPALQSFTNRTDTIFQSVPLVSGTDIYVAEVSNTRLTLRKKDGTTGYVIATGDTFNIDVLLLSAGVARIGWSLTAAELPNDLRLMDLTLATGANRTGVASGGVITWTTNPALTPVSLPGTPTDGTSSNQLPPTNDPIVDPANGDRPTQKMAAWMRNVSQGLGAVQTTAPPTPAIPPGSVAPGGAEYLVAATNPALANARLVTTTPTIAWDESVPNVATADVVPQGPDMAVQTSQGGVLSGSADFTFDPAKVQVAIGAPNSDNGLRIASTAIGVLGFEPGGLAMGAEVVASVEIASAATQAYVFPSTATPGPGALSAGFGVSTNETPGSPTIYTDYVEWDLYADPTDHLAQLTGSDYTGAFPGKAIGAAMNAAGAGATSTLFGQLKDGRYFVIWADATGAMRYNIGATLAAIRPTEDNSVSDTSGFLFGSGSGGTTIQNFMLGRREGERGRMGAPGAIGPQGPQGATGPAGSSASGPVIPFPRQDDRTRVVMIGSSAASAPASSNPEVPIVVTTNSLVDTNFCWVVSESLEIAGGVSLEIAGGARVEVTGSALLPPQFTIVKSVDQSVVSSAVLVNDAELLFTIGPSEVWTFRVVVLYRAAATTGRIKGCFTAPVGSAISWENHGIVAGATTNSGSLAIAVGTASGSPNGIFAGAGATAIACWFEGSVFAGSTAGAIQFQWAQNETSSTATTVLAGSLLKAIRIR